MFAGKPLRGFKRPCRDSKQQLTIIRVQHYVPIKAVLHLLHIFFKSNFLFEYNLRQSESGMNLYDQMMSLDSIGINTALDSINKIYIKEVSELTNDNHFLELLQRLKCNH